MLQPLLYLVMENYVAKLGLNELNHVIDYIEDHLTDDLSPEIISEYAGVSDYHFRKIFFYLSGLTLSEYIKNRKLSEANKDLLHGEKVTDVAFKYGLVNGRLYSCI